jgi:hypothetical protein
MIATSIQVAITTLIVKLKVISSPIFDDFLEFASYVQYLNRKRLGLEKNINSELQ